MVSNDDHEPVSIPLLEQNEVKVQITPTVKNGTNSESALENSYHNGEERLLLSVDVQWTNIKYSVKERRKKEKVILKEISGQAFPGELTAILGPSGCGKSTLLNILSGYFFRNVSGKVLFNGSRKHLKKHLSSFVMQDSLVLPNLTLKEVLRVAADLKCPESVTSKDKDAIIEELINALGLKDCVNTKSHLLSGGERKRLCIAQELIRSPPVLFLDEPTSGLDSLSCLQCVHLLKKLSRQGHTIICSIHQPSTHLLSYFDKLYILSEGECIYNGTVTNLVPFLASHGLHCPQYHNPADFIIEVACNVHGNAVDQLKQAVRSSEQPQDLPAIKFSANESGEHNEKKNIDYEEYATTSWTQLKVIILRCYKSVFRDPLYTQIRFVVTGILGVMLGLAYWKTGNTAQDMFNNLCFLIFSIIFFVFTSMVFTVLSFPKEMAIYLQENHNKWHRSWVYYLAKVLADFPFQIAYTIVFTVISYWMTDQPSELFRFGLYLLVCCLVSLVTQSIALICGTIAGIEVGNIIAPGLVVPALLFSNVYLKVNQLPAYLRWISHFSYVKYAFQIMMQAIYGYDRPDLECTHGFCPFQSPESFMEFVDIQDSWVVTDFLILLAILIIIRILGYFALLAKVYFRGFNYF